ncbi:hypothetical protein J5N97_018043 [Dioscorea zingiberensis]|uniref:AT3G52170-like helix-turn-helix domain-containing protein n=1 Tax=Dioscorea zingiberensis TaxID=325984 RepID=A0A9D5CM55_9LILI|nr:hypothetical protein J5N97_018043 [Dioscorea zingiberensis]
MQTIKVSCVGQTFALATFSNSRERKTRSRKTREERKAMVESFVKKYQNSNNGSFPSLNLTHKEVGGSFYIIREIVREIIQENKVLGPGSPTSKVLNLESCSEDEVDSFSMDIPNEMITSTIGHEIYQKQKELLEEHSASKEKSLDVLKSESQEILASHDDISVCKDKDIDSSDHVEQKSFTNAYPHSSVADDIADPGKPSGQTHDISKNFENLNAEQLVPSGQFVSAMSSSPASPVDDNDRTSSIASSPATSLENDVATITDKPENKIPKDNHPESKIILVNDDDRTSNIARAPDNSLENDVAMLTYKDGLPENKIPEDSLPESKITTSSSTGSITDKLLDPSVAYAVEVFPIPSSANANEPNKSILEMEGAKEVEVTDDKDPIMNGVGLTEYHTIVKEAPTIPTSQESESFEPSASRTTKIELQTVVHCDDSENICIDNPSSSGEPVSQVTGSPQFQAKVARKGQGSKTSYSSSKSTKRTIRDSEPSEINPLWSVIRAFVTAVIKFWSE